MINPTIRETALLLGGSEQWVRSLLRRGVCGDAWGTGRHRKTYVVVPGQLAEYMRISEDELEQRLKEVRKNAVL